MQSKLTTRRVTELSPAVLGMGWGGGRGVESDRVKVRDRQTDRQTDTNTETDREIDRQADK